MLIQRITHQQQQERWDKEHQTPTALLQMDSHDPSSGVTKFADWLQEHDKDLNDLTGLEICCGKGRNVIWLAQQGVYMHGLDFSNIAITEAKKRAAEAGVSDKTQFVTWDVTLPYAIMPNSLDFALDCFGSTDIESAQGRKATLQNIIAVLKPGGHLMVYLLSTDDEYHKEMIDKYPGPDEGSFIHPTTGKYEKAFTEDEVKDLYADLDLVVLERIPKKAIFGDKGYDCNHIWAVFKKPQSSDSLLQ